MIRLHITATPGSWRHLWLKQVTGFRPDVHCARCLKGRFDRAITPRQVADGLSHAFDLPDGLWYLCGVAARGGWSCNLHVAFETAQTDRVVLLEDVRRQARVVLEGARQILIPSLPSGWRGLPRPFTTCRNFQFGVDRFGYPSEPTP